MQVQISGVVFHLFISSRCWLRALCSPQWPQSVWMMRFTTSEIYCCSTIMHCVGYAVLFLNHWTLQPASDIWKHKNKRKLNQLNLSNDCNCLSILHLLYPPIYIYCSCVLGLLQGLQHTSKSTACSFGSWLVLHHNSPHHCGPCSNLSVSLTLHPHWMRT